MESAADIVPVEHIEQFILVIRGHRVLLDSDLAMLYGVTTKRLNEQVRRNPDRFPSDFMFRLTREEFDALRSQIATSKSGRGGRRYTPHAFTEHGAVMLASVLDSPRAIELSVLVVRAFVRLRQMLASHVLLARKLEELEARLGGHDKQLIALVDAIRHLTSTSAPTRRRIGFVVKEPQRIFGKSTKGKAKPGQE